jgi:hypothetical protein
MWFQIFLILPDGSPTTEFPPSQTPQEGKQRKFMSGPSLSPPLVFFTTQSKLRMRVTFGFYQHIFPLGADGGGSLMVAARYLVVLLDIQFFGGNMSEWKQFRLVS